MGPLSRRNTSQKAADLLLAYHRRAREDLDRRIARLLASRTRYAR